MRQVTMVFHHDPECWWAKSPDMPGYTAVAGSLEELRALVHEGVPFYFEDDVTPFEIVEQHAAATAV